MLFCVALLGALEVAAAPVSVASNLLKVHHFLPPFLLGVVKEVDKAVLIPSEMFLRTIMAVLLLQPTGRRAWGLPQWLIEIPSNVPDFPENNQRTLRLRWASGWAMPALPVDELLTVQMKVRSFPWRAIADKDLLLDISKGLWPRAPAAAGGAVGGPQGGITGGLGVQAGAKATPDLPDAKH